MTGAIYHAPGAHTFSRRNLISLVFSSFLLVKASSSPSLLGIHPQDEKYYGSDPINCKDGSKSFTRDRLNDGFCDCVDGTDEPGTSACPEGKFYCRNEGSSPQLLFSSRVNDQLCDCCDGSDEYEGSIRCQNTCIKNGDFSREGISHTQSKSKVNLEDMVQKLKELKIVIFLEVAFLVMAFRLLYRHVRSRRRRLH